MARDFINMGLETGAWRASRSAISPSTNAGRSDPAGRPNAARADFVVLTFDFRIDEIDCVAAKARQLDAAASAPLAIVGVRNYGWNNDAVMLLPESRRYAYRARPLTAVVAANAAGRVRLAPYYVDLLGMLEDADGRVPVFAPAHKFISQDRTHVTRAGAIFVGAILFRAPAFRDLPPPAQRTRR